MAAIATLHVSSNLFGHKCHRTKFNFNGDAIDSPEPQVHFLFCQKKKNLAPACSLLFYSSTKRKSAKIKPLSSLPPPPSSSSSQLQAVEIQPSQLLLPDHNQLTVRVRVKLQKKCQFGEQFLLVGSDRVLGSWNPLEAIPMDWSDGHVWIAKLDVPIGEPIKFKFMLRVKSGHILWQPGPDRILPTWATRNTICVFEDWDNAQVQQVTEEEHVEYRHEEATTNSCGSFTAAADLSQLGDDNMVHVSKHLNHSERDINVAQKLQVKSTSPLAVAYDATTCTPLHHTGEKLKTTLTGTNWAEESITVAAPVDMLIASNIIGRETNWSPRSTLPEGHLEKIEEIPILVPGLTPGSAMLAEDVLEHEIADSSVNAIGDEMTQLNQAVEDKSLPEEEQSISLILNHEHSQAGNATVPGFEPGNKPFEDRPSAQNPRHSSKVEDARGLSSEQSEILQNDISWGHTTLKKLLSSFPFRRLRF